MLAKVRRWWLVAFSLSVLAGIAFLPIHNTWMLSVAGFICAGWGYFVRWTQGRTQLHQKVDALADGISDLGDGITELLDARSEPATDEDAKPYLRLVRD